MATIAFTSTQLNEWTPSYQSAKAQLALEKTLVIAPLTDQSFEALLKFGNTLNIPIMPNFGGAADVNTGAALTLYAVQTTKTYVSINQWKFQAVGVSDKDSIQNYPDFLTQCTEKCTYDVAVSIDSYLANLFGAANGDAGFTDTVGTDAVALTDDVMLAAKEYLDCNNVPTTDRVFIFDPESITDLMKIDKFLRDDYVARGAVESENGLIGKSIYGAKVYVTNNLRALNTSYHVATLMQREAIALIQEQRPKVFYGDWWQQFTKVVRVSAIFGATLARATSGIRIKTRS